MKLSIRRRLYRRDLMQWIGTAALALPCLELFEHEAGAQAGAKKAKFLVLLYYPDGVNNAAFWPKNATDPTSSEILSAFAPNAAAKLTADYKSKMLVLGPQLTNGMPNMDTGMTYN